MRMKRILLPSAILALVALSVALLPQVAASGSPQTPGVVPAFHRELPAGPLPATMSPNLFTDAIVQNAYAIAARIKKTLYQEPCYCHCDRSQGHGSLLDCFVSRHGSACDICILETFYAKEQLAKGKTAAQIREGIILGEWEKLNVARYQKYPPDPAPAKK
jgi:hypothetical protein